MRTLPATALLLVAAACLAGCSGPGGQTPTVTMPAGPVAPMTTSGDVAENLTPTGAVEQQLVAAAAAAKHLPASDFTGLEPGSVYYAYDFSTHTYWAAGSLVPDPKSTKAQVSVQDNGSYDLFTRPKGGQWRAFEVGATGSACAVKVPPGVALRWHWPKHACRPGGR